MHYEPTPGELPGRQWMPSNGTIGECFQAGWCVHCARDKVMNGDVHPDRAEPEDYCPILGASYTTNEGPVEWREIEVGPGPFDIKHKCMAFIPKGEAVPAPRCPRTGDLFTASAGEGA
jgi:hypothetical protein